MNSKPLKKLVMFAYYVWMIITMGRVFKKFLLHLEFAHLNTNCNQCLKADKIRKQFGHIMSGSLNCLWWLLIYFTSHIKMLNPKRKNRSEMSLLSSICYWLEGWSLGHYWNTLSPDSFCSYFLELHVLLVDLENTEYNR